VEKWAVCYNDDFSTDDSTLNRWRDSYIRFEFTKLRSISALGVEHSTFGQIPNVHSYDLLNVAYTGLAGNDARIALVHETLESSNPCTTVDLTTAGNGNSLGAVTADRNTQTLTRLDTTSLDPTKEFAVCYQLDSTVDWYDSGIRLTVPKVHTLTAPFDSDFSDACRSGTCTTADRPMTSYPLSTNRLSRFEEQHFEYAGYASVADNLYFSVVDASLNNFNPCVDPSIPGAASVATNFGASGQTAVNSRQSIGATQASSYRLNFAQATNDLLKGPGKITGQGTHDLWFQSAQGDDFPVLDGQITFTPTLTALDSSGSGGNPLTYITEALDAPIAIGTTELTALTNTDDADTDVALQFTFNFDGSDYSQININTNGYIVLGSTSSSPNNDQVDMESKVQIAVARADLSGASGCAGRIGYDSTLTSMKVTWHEWCLLNDNANQNTFSATLHESGEIVLRYDRLDGTSDRNFIFGLHNAATVVAMSAQTVTTPTAATLLLGTEYTLCYSDSGSITDLTWRDSYIRMKTDEIDGFKTKGVEHFTSGQIPHHRGASPQGYENIDGLQFDYSMDVNSPMSGAQYISLVKASPTWRESSGSVDATTTNGGDTVVFSGNADDIATAQTDVVVGNQIKIGEEIRTIVYLPPSTTSVVVSPAFSEAHVNKEFFVLSNTQRFDAGFAKYEYSPCDVSNDATAFNDTTTTEFIKRVQSLTGSDSGTTRISNVINLPTTSMIANEPYALCYSSSVGDQDVTENNWYDSGIRLEVSALSAIEFSGYKRGVSGVATAYNLGYEDMGSADCTGTTISDHYLFESRMNDQHCRAKCNKYTDCLGYSQSTIAVPGFGVRREHCKLWRATDTSSLISGAGGAAWGNSHCMRKTSGSDEITRGKTHRKIQSVVPELQPHPEVSANILPMNSTMSIVYAGELAKSSFLSILALDNVEGTTGMNPCRDAARAAGGASSLSSGAQRACYSPGPGYIDANGPGHQLPGGECHPSGEVCADVHASIMATLHRTGCPNVDKSVVDPVVFKGLESAFATDKSSSLLEAKQMCDAVAGGSSSWEEKNACCGVDQYGNQIACTPVCQTLTAIPDCSHSVDYEGNKEVSLSTAGLLPNAHGYTICYTDGDGSSTDIGWRDSYVRVQMSHVTSIQATGVTHTDHGHLANHDGQVPLEVEYSGSLAVAGYTLSLVEETYNDNDPCNDPNIADGSNTAEELHSLSSVAGSDWKVLIKTSHLDTTRQYAVCYLDENGIQWYDSGIRTRITELTNVRYNEAQIGGWTSNTDTGMYTRDMTSSRVKVAPNSTYFTDVPVFDDGLQDIRDITSTHTIPTVYDGYSLDLSFRGDLVDGSAVAFVEVTQNFGDPCVRGATVGGEGSQPGGDAGFRYFYSTPDGNFHFDPDFANGGPGNTGTPVVTSIGNTFTFSEAQVAGLDSTKTYTLCYDPRTVAGGDNASPYEQNSVYDWYDSSDVERDWNVSPAYGNETFSISGNFDGLGIPKKGWRDSYIHFTISKIDSVGSHNMQHRVQGHIANAVDYHLSFRGTLDAGNTIALVDETANAGVPCVGGEADSVPNGVTPNTNDRSGPLTTDAACPTCYGTDVSGNMFSSGNGTSTVEINSNLLDTTKNFAICYNHDSTWYDSGIRVTVSKIVSLHYNREQQTEVAEEVYMRTWLSTNKADGADDTYPVVTNRLPLVEDDTPLTIQYRGFLPDGATVSIVSAANFIREPCASAFVAEGASDTQHHLASSATLADFTVDTGSTNGYLSGSDNNGNNQLFAVCYKDESATIDMWKDSHIRLMASKIHYLESYGIKHYTTGMVSNKESLRVYTQGRLATSGISLYLMQEDHASYPSKQRPCGQDPSSTAVGVAATGNTDGAFTLDTTLLNYTQVYALCYAESGGGFRGSYDSTWQDSGVRLTLPRVTSVTYSAPARHITSASCFSGDLWGVADCNPSKTCLGEICAGGDPSVLCAADATESCAVLPHHDGVAAAGNQIIIDGPAVSDVTFVSLVWQELGVQDNNPCRDARVASAAAISAGTADARLHSGTLATTISDGVMTATIPQLSDSNGNTNLLQFDGTFAICYTNGDGSDSDANWRDSYVRIILSKVEYVQASDMVVTTRGMFANVPSLRVSWHGSLGWKKWLNLVEVTANSNIPCNKAFAESYEQCAEGCTFDAVGTAFVSSSTTMSAMECRTECDNNVGCSAYSWYNGDTCDKFDSTAYTAGGIVHDQASASSGVKAGAFPMSGWLQSGAGSEMVDFDTVALTADALYTVCYGDEAGVPATGAPGGGAVWTDSALRLRFIRWENPQKHRVASGAATLMQFSINHPDSNGNYFDSSNDYFALLKGETDCTNAPTAPLLSDGSNAKRNVLNLSGKTAELAMPSGTGASARAIAWGSCHPMLYGPTRIDYDNTEACDEAGMYGDTNLEEGTYVMCFCDSDSGNSGCDNPNEWIKLSSSGTDPSMIRVVQTPRLGRAASNFDSSSHVGSVRAISGKSHTYNIKSTATAGLEVNDGDRIFFKADSCNSIPSSDTSGETAPILVSGYDADATSGTYKAARVITPSTNSLTSDSVTYNPRSLVSCYATSESLAGTTHARDYAQLADGLEVIEPPRLGTNAYGSTDGVIRSISDTSPIFVANSLRGGDVLFFKEMTTYEWELTGSLGVGQDVCDYAQSESCSCDAAGVLSCSNGAHTCLGMSCTQDFASGVDADCAMGTVDVHGAITSVIPTSNSQSDTGMINGVAFHDDENTLSTTTYVISMDVDGYTNPISVPETAEDVNNELKYAIDGVTRASLDMSVGNAYVFNLNSYTINANAFVLSLKEGGEHNEGEIYSTGVKYYLDGLEKTLPNYLKYFSVSSTRSVTFTPTEATILYYHSYTTENLGALVTVHRDDSGRFRLPTDVTLTSVSATTPRFLSACFIPAGAIESLHTGENCTFNNPQAAPSNDATCTEHLINTHRLADYLQVLPEMTSALKTSHNHSMVYDLNFNEPQFGTFWRTTNHWCENTDEMNQPCGVRSSDRGLTDSSTALCCQAPPNFAGASPGDVVVLKKEHIPGSGDCDGVHLITDEDYLVGAEFTRKMMLTTLDNDLTSQTNSARPDLVNGVADIADTALRQVSTKGAGLSHHSIAEGKVNELEEGFYTICYATVESGADDNEDFVQLSKTIEIIPRTATSPSMVVPQTVMLGHNINIELAASSGYQNVPSEAHSWVGLFRVGECANDSGEGQNKCHLATQTVFLSEEGASTYTFSATDYGLTAGTYEVRYFEGSSRDGHGSVCRGLASVQRGSYMQCLTESVYTSEKITVFADINSLDDLSVIPGMEMMFEGDIGRFSGAGAGLPGSKHDGMGYRRQKQY